MNIFRAIKSKKYLDHFLASDTSYRKDFSYFNSTINQAEYFCSSLSIFIVFVLNNFFRTMQQQQHRSLPNDLYTVKNYHRSIQQVQHVRRPRPGVRVAEGSGPWFRGSLLPVGISAQANFHAEPGIPGAGSWSRLEAERAN